MANLQKFTKAPDEVLDYLFNADPWLAADESIVSATVTATPDGLTIQQTDTAARAVTVWLASGTAGRNYVLTCTIVTDQNRTRQKSGIIVCAQR